MENNTILEKERVIKSFKKGEVLQKKGDKKVKAFFVHKGLLRSYTIDNNGREHIFMFAPENWLVTDVGLLSNRTESTLYIDVLEDAEVEIIDEQVFNHIEQLPVDILTDQIGKLIKRINALQIRVLLLLSAPAEERYKNFIDTYPQIVQRVPQRMIASYLGITPQALSTIRSKKTKK